jgi:hypothetical protein
MLFRPFIHLRFLSSQILPREICILAANNTFWLVDVYKKIYTLRYTPTFMPYFILASSISHFLRPQSGIAGVPAPSHVFGIEHVRALFPHQPFARRAFHILRFFARQIDPSGRFDQELETDLDADEEEYLSLDLGSMNFFYPTGDLPSAVRGIDNNLLFRPFPKQGLPLLGGGRAGLERAGFRARQ